MGKETSLIIYRNYTIDEVFDRFRNGDTSEEISYLFQEVIRYYIETKMRIEKLYDMIPKGDRKTAMHWIMENTGDIETAAYLRKKYLGTLKESDYFRKANGRYKTIRDIGIDVWEGEPRLKKEDWISVWKQQAEEIRKTVNIDKVKIFESHAHLNNRVFSDCYEELLSIMKEAGIGPIVIPTVEYSTNIQAREMFKKYDDVFLAYGAHPKYIFKEVEDRWAEFGELLKDEKCVAVGEIGLDYSRYPNISPEEVEIQKRFFHIFITKANDERLPICLHVRDAAPSSGCPYDANNDTLEILKKTPAIHGAVLHCFGGNEATMRRYLSVGIICFGIGGRITYGDEDFIRAVKVMPSTAIMLETDSPYMKLRGQASDSVPNTPLSLLNIAEAVAKIRGCSTGDILDISYRNGMALFKRIKKQTD